MRRKLVVALFILNACLVTGSCKKLGEPPKPTGPLTFETVRFTDAIPKDYGQLIGVTQNPEFPGWVGFWFQKPDGTITGVAVNVNRGEIYQRTLTIPRK